MTPCDAYKATLAINPRLPGIRPPAGCDGAGVPAAPIPAVWGPPIWHDFHTAAALGQLTPAFMAALLARIPASSCSCQSHWKVIMDRSPAPYGGTAADQFLWSWQRHQDVNLALGRIGITLAAAKALYGVA